MFLSCHVRVSERINTLESPECQQTPCSKQEWNLKFKWPQLDSNPEPLSLQTNTQPFGQTGRLWTKWFWVRVQLQSLCFVSINVWFSQSIREYEAILPCLSKIFKSRWVAFMDVCSVWGVFSNNLTYAFIQYSL